MAWSRKRENVAPLKMPKYEYAVAVCGGISHRKGLVNFAMREKSFTSADFLTFVEVLRQSSDS